MAGFWNSGKPIGSCSCFSMARESVWWPPSEWYLYWWWSMVIAWKLKQSILEYLILSESSGNEPNLFVSVEGGRMKVSLCHCYYIRLEHVLILYSRKGSLQHCLLSFCAPHCYNSMFFLSSVMSKAPVWMIHDMGDWNERLCLQKNASVTLHLYKNRKMK